ncbi:hypothetical protein [Helicobacter bilis]|uniref:hypothetical protein n=1 Tax=Helicobacter bilis TaxID=37372 RepID=UPI000399C7DD|nr:hypothetical protein [Helicobacter bilis]
MWQHFTAKVKVSCGSILRRFCLFSSKMQGSVYKIHDRRILRRIKQKRPKDNAPLKHR